MIVCICCSHPPCLCVMEDMCYCGKCWVHWRCEIVYVPAKVIKKWPMSSEWDLLIETGQLARILYPVEVIFYPIAFKVQKIKFLGR